MKEIDFFILHCVQHCPIFRTSYISCYINYRCTPVYLYNEIALEGTSFPASKDRYWVEQLGGITLSIRYDCLYPKQSVSNVNPNT